MLSSLAQNGHAMACSLVLRSPLVLDEVNLAVADLVLAAFDRALWHPWRWWWWILCWLSLIQVTGSSSSLSNFCFILWNMTILAAGVLIGFKSLLDSVRALYKS